MKKTILTSALCLTLMATGCVNNGAALTSAPETTAKKGSGIGIWKRILLKSYW